METKDDRTAEQRVTHRWGIVARDKYMSGWGAARCFADACRCSREHAELATNALRLYGDHGAPISGCVREHFPEHGKAELRLVAHNATAYSDAAWHHRPRRMRSTTMRALARAVAARDGSGFYGPQA